MVWFHDVRAVLITREKEYPKEVYKSVSELFPNITVCVNCPSISTRYDIAYNSPEEHIYIQDDDCIAPMEELYKNYTGDMITCAMKKQHLEYYKDSQICLLGWGALFPRRIIKNMDKYIAMFGSIEPYKREADRIFSYLNYPQKRLELPIQDIKRSCAMSNEQNHYESLRSIEQKLKQL